MPHWYRALEARMVETAVQIESQPRATPCAACKLAQAGADTAFPSADLTITNPEPVEDLATALGRRSPPRYGRWAQPVRAASRRSVWALYADKAVPADQCSTGEQKALLISLILANARALAADLGAAPILLLDEVAAHLDTQRRAALYDEICALGAQAIMTGTEAALFDSLGPRAQGFAVSETDNHLAHKGNPAYDPATRYPDHPWRRRSCRRPRLLCALGLARAWRKPRNRGVLSNAWRGFGAVSRWRNSPRIKAARMPPWAQGP